MEHPEGITVNNNLPIPEIYIVTDPSSPHGDPYVPAMFTFTKPIVGSGNHFTHSPDENTIPNVECDGCDEVWFAIEHIPSSSSNSSSNELELMIITFAVLIVLILIMLCMSGVLILASKRYHFKKIFTFKKLYNGVPTEDESLVIESLVIEQNEDNSSCSSEYNDLVCI